MSRVDVMSWAKILLEKENSWNKLARSVVDDAYCALGLLTVGVWSG